MSNELRNAIPATAWAFGLARPVSRQETGAGWRRGRDSTLPTSPPRVGVNATCGSQEAQSSPLASPSFETLTLELAEVVANWAKLSSEIRATILTLVRISTGGSQWVRLLALNGGVGRST